jgi:hypothetical protein
VAYEHSEGWGAASTKIVISGWFGAGTRGRQNDVRRRGLGNHAAAHRGGLKSASDLRL